MNNSERILLYTLPRWAGVTVLSIKEPLSDMWLGGEDAGHHSGIPYDPDGYERLRIELQKDFRHAPSRGEFSAGGSIRTIRDLVSAIAGVGQARFPSPSEMLAALLPSEELARLATESAGAAVYGDKVRGRARRGSGGSELRPKRSGGDRRRSRTR